MRVVGGAIRCSVVTGARVWLLLGLFSFSDVSISGVVFGKLEDVAAAFWFGDADDGGGIFPCTTCAAVRRLLMSMPRSLRASLHERPMCKVLPQYLQVRVWFR